MDNIDLENIDSVLKFWFGSKFYDQFPPQEKIRLWFQNKNLADRLIKKQFYKLVCDALDGRLSHWVNKPKGRLALIILLDQCTRNCFRNTKEAFSGDKIALSLCLDGIHKNDHTKLIACELVFFYMPLEHSEDIKDQEMLLEWSSKYLENCSKETAKYFQGFHHWVKLHHDIIQQFSRFPWRNKILGRKSSQKEIEYLQTAEDFGQN